MIRPTSSSPNCAQHFNKRGTEAARFLGAHRLANLERFYRRLSTALANEEGGPQAVLRALRVAVAEEEDESDSPPGDDSLDAVRVMTVHKSKGLTFQHVYLADVHGGGSGSARLTGMRNGRAQGPKLSSACLACRRSDGSRWRSDQERVSSAETVRLLYVALTRPQKRLVVCGKRNLPDSEKVATGKHIGVTASSATAQWPRACRGIWRTTRPIDRPPRFLRGVVAHSLRRDGRTASCRSAEVDEARVGSAP